MRIEKPVTNNMKIKANTVYRFLCLRYPKYATKEELMDLLQVSERQVRDVLNTLKKKVPVLSNSANKGYKIAMTANDVEEVIHCWKEIDSRIEDLEQNKIALINFVEKWKK